MLFEDDRHTIAFKDWPSLYSFLTAVTQKHCGLKSDDRRGRFQAEVRVARSRSHSAPPFFRGQTLVGPHFNPPQRAVKNDHSDPVRIPQLSCLSVERSNLKVPRRVTLTKPHQIPNKISALEKMVKGFCYLLIPRVRTEDKKC